MGRFLSSPFHGPQNQSTQSAHSARESADLAVAACAQFRANVALTDAASGQLAAIHHITVRRGGHSPNSCPSVIALDY